MIGKANESIEVNKSLAQIMIRLRTLERNLNAINNRVYLERRGLH